MNKPSIKSKNLYTSILKSRFYKMASVQIRITISKGVDSLLERISKKLGKKKSTLARELMEQKMYDLKVIQKELEEI